MSRETVSGEGQRLTDASGFLPGTVIAPGLKWLGAIFIYPLVATGGKHRFRANLLKSVNLLYARHLRPFVALFV